MCTAKRIFPFFVVLSLLCGFIPIHSKAAPLPYPDMERSWFQYRESVDELKQNGVITGYDDGTFKPKNPVNRAEFLTLVFRENAPSTPISGDCFWDVPSDAWFAPYVCAAKRRGIVSGYSSGAFKPNQTVNVAEAMKMLLLTHGENIQEPSRSTWYKPYVDAFERKGILRSTAYLPGDELTRERAADMIARHFHAVEEKRDLSRSKGCSKPEPRVAPTSISVSGSDRSFLLTVPRNYNTDTPSPLIIAFHGRTNSNEQVRQYLGFDREASEFFIAYPAAIKNGSSFTWSGEGDGKGWLRDVAFFDNLVESLTEQYCIDMDRIFVTGHSLGAWFANSVACIRGGIVRGSGTVGGSGLITDCSGPTAAWIAHNPHDNLASFDETVRAKDLRVRENQCGIETIPQQSTSLKCVDFVGCMEGNPVVWCPHEVDTDHRGVYYPHTWPPGAEQGITGFFRSLK